MFQRVKNFFTLYSDFLKARTLSLLANNIKLFETRLQPTLDPQDQRLVRVVTFAGDSLVKIIDYFSFRV